MKITLKEELEKVKKMNGKQKWSYYKTYYLGPTIVIIILILCLAWFLYDSIISNKKILYSGGIMGVDITEEGRSYLSDEYLNYLGGNPKKEMIALSADNFLTVSEEEALNADGMDMALYAQISVGEYDYFVMSKGTLEKYKAFEIYVDPTNLCKEVGIEEDKIVIDEESKLPMAIDITDICGDKIGASEEYYLVFVNVKNVPEEDKRFLEYLLGK